jgi:hypothetical protein
MTLDEIETASQTDSYLKKVRDCLTRNKWSKQGSMKQYYLVKKRAKCEKFNHSEFIKL